MYDRMRGLCAPFLLTAFVLFCMGTAAIADDDNDVWHVSNAFGNVWVTVGGVQHASLSHSRILKPGNSIQHWSKWARPSGARRRVHAHLAKLSDRNS